MSDTIAENPEKVQNAALKSGHQKFLHRWEKYSDGDGHLWIVTNLFGFDENGKYGSSVELLHVDKETTVDYPTTTVVEWVENGTLKRVQGAIVF